MSHNRYDRGRPRIGLLIGPLRGPYNIGKAASRPLLHVVLSHDMSHTLGPDLVIESFLSSVELSFLIVASIEFPRE